MAEIVLIFADKWSISPFDVLEKDIDDFFMMINSMSARAQKKTHESKDGKKQKKKQERIRVNDKTASGGWF